MEDLFVSRESLGRYYFAILPTYDKNWNNCVGKRRDLIPLRSNAIGWLKFFSIYVYSERIFVNERNSVGRNDVIRGIECSCAYDERIEKFYVFPFEILLKFVIILSEQEDSSRD